MGQANTIAIWGHKGKTTFAANLAWSLVTEKQQKIVTLVSTNTCFGDLQSLFGFALRDDKGLAKAIEDDEGVHKHLRRVATEGAGNDIFLMALPNDFDAMEYSPPELDRCEQFMEQVCADVHTHYAIIDCSADIYNPFSGIALVNADVILCLHMPGTACYQWYRAMRTFREQLDLDAKTKHVLYAHDMSCNAEQYFRELGLSIAHEIPFVKEARHFENRGELLCSSDSRGVRDYRRAMARVCMEL